MVKQADSAFCAGMYVVFAVLYMGGIKANFRMGQPGKSAFRDCGKGDFKTDAVKAGIGPGICGRNHGGISGEGRGDCGSGGKSGGCLGRNLADGLAAAGGTVCFDRGYLQGVGKRPPCGECISTEHGKGFLSGANGKSSGIYSTFEEQRHHICEGGRILE